MLSYKRVYTHDNVLLSKEEIIRFWESLGYKFKKTPNNEVVGYRGKLINNFFTMNMKKLATKVRLIFVDDITNYIEVVIEVKTIGQAILKEEAILWPSELEIFNHFIQDIEVDIETFMSIYNKERKKTQRKYAIITGVPLFIMIVIILVFTILL